MTDRPRRVVGPDGDVLIRLRRRAAVATALAGLGVAALVVTGLWWPGWLFATVTAVAVGVVAVAALVGASAAFGRRARCWARAARSLADSGPAGPAEPGMVGPPRSLHRNRPGAPLRRRHLAQIVPVRTVAGPLSGGAALLVHGRRDGQALQDGDTVTVQAVRLRSAHLLLRPSDGTVFVGESGWFSAW